MKVALVHDYLNQRGGAERVFAHIARAWPDAPIYTALYDERVAGSEFPVARVRRSYLARIPLANRYFRALAPFYPRAFEAFDLRGYDAIVSSTTSDVGASSAICEIVTFLKTSRMLSFTRRNGWRIVHLIDWLHSPWEVTQDVINNGPSTARIASKMVMFEGCRFN